MSSDVTWSHGSGHQAVAVGTAIEVATPHRCPCSRCGNAMTAGAALPTIETERAALAANLDSDVAAGLELLARSPPLWPIGAEDWAIAVTRARAFAEAWDSLASGRMVDTLELYGMHRRAPYARLSAMGAAWLIARSNHRPIAAAGDAITVATRTGARLRIYRTTAPPPDAVLAWTLVA